MTFFGSGSEKIMAMLPWLIGATVVVIVFIISLKVWSGFFGRRVRDTTLESGMKFQDVDTLKKKGLVSEAEYKEIRQALARRESQRGNEEAEALRSQAMLREVALNPDAARKFLPPEGAPPKGHAAGGAPANPAPASLEQQFAKLLGLHGRMSAGQIREQYQAQLAKYEAAKLAGMGEEVQRVAAEKRGEIEAAYRYFVEKYQLEGPPPTGMNNPRVVAARNEGRAEDARAAAAGGEAAPRDIDLLLAKGAISQAEYDRLRQFFR